MSSFSKKQSITVLIIILGGIPSILYLYSFISCQPLREFTMYQHLFHDYQESLCNRYATKRGLHQKVISFSLFLNPRNSSLIPNSQYINGINNNIKKAKEFYSGWLIRIYTYSHRDLNGNLRDLVRTNSDVFVCDIENIPSIGNLSGKMDAAMWRYLPLFDPTVDVFISRDLDSSFRTRELVAVTEWLTSNKTFHAMRDHPFHVGHPLFAGMWGAKSANIKSPLKDIYKHLTLTYGTHNGSFYVRGYDQSFLSEYIYPLIKNDLLSHDSYFCEYFTDAIPFSMQRKNSTDFVANYVSTPNLYPIATKCPSACRPSFGKDWEFC